MSVCSAKETSWEAVGPQVHVKEPVRLTTGLHQQGMRTTLHAEHRPSQWLALEHSDGTFFDGVSVSEDLVYSKDS